MVENRSSNETEDSRHAEPARRDGRMLALKRCRAKLRKTQTAASFVAQEKFAEIVAQLIREGRSPADNPTISHLIREELLRPWVFTQKSAGILDLYRQLLGGLPSPRAILEIGIKNGSSLLLWKKIFADAAVVGLDLSLKNVVRHPGIIYMQGDQSDTATLDQIVREHGPFGLIVDDGSHIGRDQLNTLRALEPAVTPGGAYVVEDVQTGLKPHSRKNYGGDVWAEFVGYVFEYLRGNPPDLTRRRGARFWTRPTPLSLEVAAEVAPKFQEISFAHQTIVLRKPLSGDDGQKLLASDDARST